MSNECYQVVCNPEGRFEKDGKRMDLIPAKGAKYHDVMEAAYRNGLRYCPVGDFLASFRGKLRGNRWFDLKG